MRFRLLKKIPARAWPFLILIAVTHLAVYYVPMSLNQGRLHYDLTTALDRAVPFLPLSAVPYVLAFPYWILGFLYAASLGKRPFYRVFAAIELAHLWAFCTYLVFPTTIALPDIPADRPFGWLAGLVYSLDEPVNLFPSMHCYVSWMIWLSVRGQAQVPRGTRRFCLAFSLLVCVSTQTLKQHYLADLVSGVLLAEAAFWVSGWGRRFFHSHFRKSSLPLP